MRCPRQRLHGTGVHGDELVGDDGVPAQMVDYAKLRERLLKDGQVL